MSRVTKSDLECMLLDVDFGPKALPFSFLSEITNHFSDERVIGSGGFAVVYKGVLDNGDVAVKRLLSNAYMYEKEFHREIECLMKVQHKNIVRFRGYCVDTQGNVASDNGKFVMADQQERLLCFDYLQKGSLHNYIKDASCGLEWTQRYKIIKGICEGLCYLHQKNILHLDLKPANILLDENMRPKITDFGLSRCFEEDQTRAVTSKVGGTMGYLAPEFTDHELTYKFDLYSLGVIITEILTGKKGYQDIEDVLENWSNRLQISEDSPKWEQIRVCAEIGMECTEFNPKKRPACMKDIIDRLVETETDEYLHDDDHLLEHLFYPELSSSIPCSLHLSNMGDHHVAYRLMKRSNNSLEVDDYSTDPLYGVMPPRSSCTLVMTTREMELVKEKRIDLVLQSSTISGETTLSILTYTQVLAKDKHACNKFFKNAKELGHAVYEVAVKAICTRPGETTSHAARLTIVTEPMRGNKALCDLDAHPTEPWIVTGHFKGEITVWNHESKTMMATFKISNKTVCDIKLHATKKWIFALTGDGLLHVYDYSCVTQIQKHTSFKIGSSFFAIHPTKPYVLSDTNQLWEGDESWQSTRKFGTYGLQAMVFNPEDPDSLACVPYSQEYVEIWRLDSSEPSFTMNGHSSFVHCIDFCKRGDRLYLISGSNDCTAKIWDLQTKECVHTMDVFMSPVIHVISVPDRPYLVTCTQNSTIYVWSSIDFSLKTTVNFSSGGWVKGLVCLRGSRRIAIGQLLSMSIMDIDDTEDQVVSEGNNQDSVYAMGQSSNP